MKKLDMLDIHKSKIVINQADTRLIKFPKYNSASLRDVYDFSINGKTLRELIHTNDNAAPDLSTGLQSAFVIKERKMYINRLLGKTQADLASGRVALLVCPIDGDLECGAVGCRIKFNNIAKTVTWYDFAWDGNNDTGTDDDDEDAKVKGLGSFTFDEQQYCELMLQTIDDLSANAAIKP